MAASQPSIEANPAEKHKENAMDSTTIIRIAAGVLFVVILIVLVQRRRSGVK
jgi:hypothetical protein